MFYVAKLVKKTRIFQPAFKIDENVVYITNTQKAKKRFLKSGIKNVVFSKDFMCDDFFKALLLPMHDYDKEFLYSFLEGWIEDVIKFLNVQLPLDEIAVIGCDKKAEVICIPFAKLITVKAVGEDKVKDGIQVRYVKKIKTPPALAITENEGLPFVLGVPTISLGDFKEGDKTAHWTNLSFKTDIFPFEINAASLIFLLKRGEKINYTLTGYRKKLPPLFTFC